MILNRYPYDNGHVMSVPYNHVPSLENLDPPTLTEMMLLVNRGMAALRACMRPDGFNVGANLGSVAGAGIEDHVHIHVVPRWAGDTKFMPVVGDMRVVPQTWEQPMTRCERPWRMGPSALRRKLRPGYRPTRKALWQLGDAYSNQVGTCAC